MYDPQVLTVHTLKSTATATIPSVISSFVFLVSKYLALIQNAVAPIRWNEVMDEGSWKNSQPSLPWVTRRQYWLKIY